MGVQASVDHLGGAGAVYDVQAPRFDIVGRDVECAGVADHGVDYVGCDLCRDVPAYGFDDAFLVGAQDGTAGEPQSAVFVQDERLAGLVSNHIPSASSYLGLESYLDHVHAIGTACAWEGITVPI